MRDFHSQLQDYIKRCPNVTVVAEASGINRTTLQHYMSGKRVPTKEETVLDIAKAMMLSPEERKMLLQAYSIAVEGEDVFGRREYIRDLITHLKTENISESRIENDLTKYWELPDGKTVTEKTDLYKITRQLLEAAIAGGGEMYFVVQPEFEFLFQLMASMHLESGQLKVEHIFGMKKTMAPQEDNMSLRCVKMILYVAPNFPDYQPYYFYDNRCDGRSYLSPAPFCMIYKDAFLIFSNDYQTGYLGKNKIQADFYKVLFKRMKEQCYSAIEKRSGVNSATVFLKEIIWDIEPQSAIHYDLCFMPFIRPEWIANCLGLQDDSAKVVAGEIQDYQQRLVKILTVSGEGFDVVGSQQGFDELLSTGCPDEIPREFFKEPLSLKERILLLDDLQNAVKNGKYHFRLMREKETIAKRWTLTTCVSRTLIYQNYDNGLNYFYFTEPGILAAFSDYQVFIRKDPLLMSYEETLDYLETKKQELTERQERIEKQEPAEKKETEENLQ